MGFVVLLGFFVMLAVLLYKFITYVVPAFFGMAAFLWAANTGAGLGSVVVGGAVGVAVFLLGHFALRSRQTWRRWLVAAVFVLPSAIAGYYATLDIGGADLIPSPLWRQVFAVIAGLAFAAVAFKSLTKPIDGLSLGAWRPRQ